MNTFYWENRYKRQGKRTVGCCSFSQGEFEKKTRKAEATLLKCLVRNKIAAERWLDVGCGWGRLANIYLSFCKEISGIDIIPWAIEEAKKQFPFGKFSVYDGKKIPFSDKHFDAILTWTVLQHVSTEDISDFCKEIVRVMASGAYLIVYENVSTWRTDKSHIWFRGAGTYKLLFEALKMIDEELVPDADGNDEHHVLIVFKKEVII